MQRGYYEELFTMKNDKIHSGHRARMRNKFIKYSVDTFETYELLEMLLYHVIPYKNTHPVSKNLLIRFGNIDGVFSASREELMTVEGVGGAVADFLLAVAEFMHSDTVQEKKIILDEYAAAGKFLSDHLLSGKERHGVAMLLLDNDMGFIGVKTLYTVDFESAAVKAKSFIEYAVEHNASISMIAHLHPYGPLFPTYGDFATNGMICDALRSVGINLVEHYVVTNEGFVGIMSNLTSAFKQTAGLSKFLKSKEAADNDGITLF